MGIAVGAVTAALAGSAATTVVVLEAFAEEKTHSRALEDPASD